MLVQGIFKGVTSTALALGISFLPHSFALFADHATIGPMPPPRTIKDYKRELARLGVPLPVTTARKEEYENLYTAAMSKKAQLPPAPPLENVTPQFVNTNIPLSMQEAMCSTPSRATPLQPTPATPQPASEEPVYDFGSTLAEEPASSPPLPANEIDLSRSCTDDNHHLRYEGMQPSVRRRERRSRHASSTTPVLAALAMLVIALACGALGGGGYWLMMQSCALEQAGAAELTSTLATTGQMAADVADAEQEEQEVVAHSEQQEEDGKESEPLPMAAPDQMPPAVEEDPMAAAEALEVTATAEQTIVPPSSPDEVQCAARTDPEAAAAEDVAAPASAQPTEPAEATAAIVSVEARTATEATEVAEVAEVSEVVAEVAEVAEAVAGEAVAVAKAEDEPAETDDAASSASRFEESRAAAASVVVAAAAAASFVLGVPARVLLPACSEAVSWLAKQAAASAQVQWALSSATECLWALLRAFVNAGVAVAKMALRWAAYAVSHGLPWLASTAPGVARHLLTLVLMRPELVGAAVTAVGSLHCFRKAYFWHWRWREAQRAQRAAQIDAAARWVVGELRAHSARWTPISGGCPPIAPSELRARVPHAVLADRALWTRVASRVRSDMSVRVVPAGHDGVSEEEGWLFFGNLPSHGNLCSPTSAFSPLSPASSAFVPMSAFSPALPSRVRATPA